MRIILGKFIAPARVLGIGNFWITENGAPSEEELPTSAGCGNIQDLLPWIDSVQAEGLDPDFNRVETMLAVLRATPAVVDAFSGEFDSNQWDEHPQPGEWNYTERKARSNWNLPCEAFVLPSLDHTRWPSRYGANQRHLTGQVQAPQAPPQGGLEGLDL